MSQPLKLLALAAAGFGLLMLPGVWRIRPYYKRRRLRGSLETVADAVAASRASQLSDWELVAFAQRLVNEKFVFYSLRNLWDPPGRAFAYGMGYCTQYNLALKQILDRLGVANRAVYAFPVQVLDNPAWRMGHTWLRVQVGDEERDVCAGRPGNAPGRVHFRPLGTVREGNGPLLFLTHLGTILVSGASEWRSVLTGRPAPPWALRRN
ncbi:MAG: hypothetical protein R3300_00730 [Candidatus Promineifilaceae bacterium]|nr:hypothetical protein [Candidatus Promineifilaceae bacterium]